MARFIIISLFFLFHVCHIQAADYTSFLTVKRGFTEIKATSSIIASADYYYILVPAETNELIVGVGNYEAKPDWASNETKALRYKSAETDPVLDLSNFFTIEKKGLYIGLRNVVYNTDLFQTHDNAGYMYVNTYTDKTLDEWSQLTPTYQNGYWLFESGKYPMSSENWACGYLGPWNKKVEEGEPIALNRRNTEGDDAGHYRLFQISKNDLMSQLLYATILTTQNGFSEVLPTEDFIADPTQCYFITSYDNPGLFLGLGKYERKPSWAANDTKSLRYCQAGNPVTDLSNFFTIEQEGDYIGLRNVTYYKNLFLVHETSSSLYLINNDEPQSSEWCYLKPTSYHSKCWLFENKKTSASSSTSQKTYIGPYDNVVKAEESISANITSTNKAGKFRIWRISRNDLFQLMQTIVPSPDGSVTGLAEMTWKITNPSFESNEKGWTLNGKDTNGNDEFKAREYSMTGKAGSLLMNAQQWWAPSLSVSQTVTGIPAGEYELSGTMSSWEGRTVSFAANSNSVSAIGVNETGGIRLKTSVTIGTDGQLVIHAGSSTDWWTEGRPEDENDSQCFFRLDDVQLHCKTLFLDAIAIKLPNDYTKLVPGQWYYYETDYGTEHILIGQLDNIYYSTDGNKLIAEANRSAVQQILSLPMGRTYFQATKENTMLIVKPYRQIEEGTFTVAALNVDGLPNKIATITLNSDGPGSDGTKKISQYLAMKNYDLIGCSEDFNYHGSLISSLMDQYSWGTVRATLSADNIPLGQLLQGKFRFDTDGLNLIWKNSVMSAANETWTRWNSLSETEGNQYVKKGYRHYDLYLGGDAVIDVFVLHMDAGDTEAIWSRLEQWKQLADAINNSDHSRSKLIIGDTNSRWTREDIVSNFVRLLHADFHVNDVWVELFRKGIYPTTDMADLTDTSDPDDYSKFEVVDKIIYINTYAANAVQLAPQKFWIEQDYTYDTVEHNGNYSPLGDHRPVVATFKYRAPGEIIPTDITLPYNDSYQNEYGFSDNGTSLNNPNVIYDLTGRRINAGQQLREGIYIRNGHKILIRKNLGK